MNSLLALSFSWFGACLSNGGQPLAKMPPSQFSVRIGPAQSGMGDWNVSLEIVPLDTSLCPTISSKVAASLNGKALGLSDSGGPRRIKGGADTCGYPRYEAWGITGISAGVVASVRLSDDSATYVIESSGAFSQGQANLTAPADGILHPGTLGTVAISTEGDSIDYATISFSLDGEPTTSLFSSDSTTGYNAMTVNGMSFAFSVPRTVSGAGPGRLSGSVDILDKVSVCTGPAQCNVQTAFAYTIPATLANP